MASVWVYSEVVRDRVTAGLGMEQTFPTSFWGAAPDSVESAAHFLSCCVSFGTHCSENEQLSMPKANDRAPNDQPAFN